MRDEDPARRPTTLHHRAAEIEVETWFLHYASGTWRTAPPITEALALGVHPHVVAGRAATERRLRHDVVHSTSWRMVGGRLVLTYIVVTNDDLGFGSFDVHPDRAHDFTGTPPDHATHPDDPTVPPDAITDWDVIHHALHHLALLASTNATIASALSLSARRSLRPLVPAGAGVLNRVTRVS